MKETYITKYLYQALAWFLVAILSIGWNIIPLSPSDFIKPTRAADSTAIIFRDSTDTFDLTGWTLLSAVNGKFIRAAAAYDVVGGGNATHTHTLSLVSVGLGSTTGNNYDNKNSGTSVGTPAHTHIALASSSITPNNNDPSNRTLLAYYYTAGGIPSTLPDNAIVMSLTTDTSGVWSNFELYSAIDGRLLKGTTGSTADGGNNTPTHTVATGLGAASDTPYTNAGGSGGDVASPTHTHSAGGGVSTDGPSIEPPYREIVFKRATAADVSIPSGAILGFQGATFESAGWASISGAGQDYNNKFLKADQSGGALDTGGTSIHSHADVTVSSGVVSGTVNVDVSPSRGQASDAAHTHPSNVVVRLQADVDHTPPYVDIVLGQYTAVDTLDVTAPTDVQLASDVHPNENTPDYTFSSPSENIVITDSTSNEWSLTVISTQFSDGGSNTIAASNIKLKTNNNLSATPTTMTEIDSNITETNFTGGLSIDVAKEIVGGNTSADGEYNIQPTFFVIIPPTTVPADYSADFTFTVA